jgi:hypothetical protein
LRGKHYTDGWLTARWSKKENDILYGYPATPDGHLLHGFFRYATFALVKPLLEELKERGYDITTLEFAIRRKVDAGHS